ncbi:SGNH/GDSL hydrolase family protein [Mesorhizobium sp. B2-3-10]|uniref:SGNH/GDSL hydrolase family protein n=1 Tax=Mesorhizobium sp. B2-3-10 TaxID=2589954 RepID=UPI0011281421|nr:SGNH/GDSL hydrolase family protein [Mesorhizobium sp. B2-3-10]TPL98327.1 SGNH/GDSL hydrolase family protein [Mesorhizobium sp. B2-3-10]
MVQRASFVGRMGPPSRRRGTSYSAYPALASAVAASKAGLGRAKILCVGDSTTAGSGGQVVSNSYPDKLKNLLASDGAYQNNRFSDANLALSFDTRISYGAGWATNGTKCLGGSTYRNSTTSNPIVFTPLTAFDSVDIYLYAASSVNVTIGGGTTVTVSGGGGGAIYKKTVTVAQAGLPAGIYPVSIVAVGDAVYAGADCYVASTGIDVLNVGASGYTSTDLATTLYSVASVLPTIAPHLTIINVGINDYNNASPVSEATYKANVQALIDAAQNAGSDVQLVIPNRIGSSNAANEVAFQQYIRDLVTLNGLQPALDVGSVLGTYAAANAAGYMNDTLHPSSAGYTLIAQMFYNALRAVVTYNYDSAATALFARMTAPPTLAQRNRINTLITSLKTAGVWGKLDCLYVMAAPNAQAANLNWISPNFTLTPVNSPVFTANQGYYGDGASSYLKTGFNPAVGTNNYTLNSASFGVWINVSSTASATLTDIGQFDGSNGSLLRAFSASSFVGSRLNSASTATTTPTTVTDAKGMTSASRLANGSYTTYRDGSPLAAQSVASSAIASVEFVLGALNTNGTITQYTQRPMSATVIGGGLTGTEVAARDAALATYRTSVGLS